MSNDRLTDLFNRANDKELPMAVRVRAVIDAGRLLDQISQRKKALKK